MKIAAGPCPPPLFILVLPSCLIGENPKRACVGTITLCPSFQLSFILLALPSLALSSLPSPLSFLPSFPFLQRVRNNREQKGRDKTEEDGGERKGELLLRPALSLFLPLPSSSSFLPVLCVRKE